MKKIFYIFLAVILCIGLAGCSADKAVETLSSGEKIVLSEQSGNKGEINTESAHSTTTEKNKNFSQKSVTKPSEKTTNKKGASKVREKSTAKATVPSSKSTTKSAKKPSSTAAVTTTAGSVSCTVSIECKSILENMDDLKPGHESFVPSDGVILSRESVTVKNGSTAYDVLKVACDSQGIMINATSSSYGKYIVGFNNIDEKDCGSQSGWTYTVNSKSIWQSCDKYVVKEGDNIKFSFVCKY